MKKYVLIRKFLLAILSIVFVFCISFSSVSLLSNDKTNVVSATVNESTNGSFGNSFGAESSDFSDKQLLENNRVSTCYANDADTLEKARDYAKTYITNLGITTQYTTLNEKYVEPQNPDVNYRKYL